MKRITCSACGYDDLSMFLDLGFSPVADAYTSSASEASHMHPLQLAVCRGCWLVQLMDVLPGAELFGTGYSFYSSASPPLSEYHERYAWDVIQAEKDLIEGGFVVEIGCNDGDFLRHFPCKTLGVDPAAGPAAKASEDHGLQVLVKPFSTDVASEIVSEHGQAKVIVANHVLAHVESVSDVLGGVARLLSRSGVAYVEVQYLPDLLVNNAFDLVYHEHRNFFSLTALSTAAELHGLYVDEAQLTDRQGGSLRVSLRRRRVLVSARRDWILNSEAAWLRYSATYAGFQGRVDRIRSRLQDLVHEYAPVIGYGAPAKATTLLNYCRIDRRYVDRIIDTTPAKQGRYVPGTGIEIVADETLDRDAVLLLAWNYAGPILRKHASYSSGGGRWIVPIPAPVML